MEIAYRSAGVQAESSRSATHNVPRCPFCGSTACQQRLLCCRPPAHATAT